MTSKFDLTYFLYHFDCIVHDSETIFCFILMQPRPCGRRQFIFTYNVKVYFSQSNQMQMDAFKLFIQFMLFTVEYSV